MTTRIRHYLIPALVLVLTSLLTACSPGPADTAEDFLSLMADGKVSEANKLATESTAQLMQMAVSFGIVDVDPDFDFQLVEEKIDDNEATITYRSGDDGKLETIHLVKLDGDWKVHETKH
jgi:hypothetical protein